MLAGTKPFANPRLAGEDARPPCGMRALMMGVACLVALSGLPDLASGRQLARRPGRIPIQAALINTDSVAGSADWDNRVVRGQVRKQGCDLSIDIRKADAIAGRDLVCNWGGDSANAIARGGVSQVFGMRVDDRGRVRLRVDGADEAGCGSLGDTIVYHAQLDCYLATAGTQPGDYDWRAACTGAGGLLLPPERSEAPAGGGLLGGCFFPSEGGRIPAPSAPRLSTSGAFTRGE